MEENNFQPISEQNVPQVGQQPATLVSQETLPVTQEKGSRLLKILIYISAATLFLGPGVLGFWFYQEKIAKKPTPPATLTPTPTLSPPTLTPTPEFTIPADWKTYSNQNLGFSFKYPPGWLDAETNILSTKTSVTIKDGKEFDDLIARLEITSGVYYNQSLQREMTLVELINRKNFPAEALTSEEVTLKDWEGTRFTHHVHGVGYFVTYIFLAKPNNPTGIVSLVYRHANDPTEYKSEMPKTLALILSTFEFLD